MPVIPRVRAGLLTNPRRARHSRGAFAVGCLTQAVWKLPKIVVHVLLESLLQDVAGSLSRQFLQQLEQPCPTALAFGLHACRLLHRPS